MNKKEIKQDFVLGGGRVGWVRVTDNQDHEKNTILISSQIIELIMILDHNFVHLCPSAIVINVNKNNVVSFEMTMTN